MRCIAVKVPGNCFLHIFAWSVTIQTPLYYIISDKNLLNSRLSELRYLLQQRNYPKSLLEHGINKATCHDINELLQIKDKAEKYAIPYVSTHNPKNQEFFQIIKSNLSLLERDQKMNEVFKKFQIIKSQRQSPSLKKILTRAKFENIEKHQLSVNAKRQKCNLSLPTRRPTVQIVHVCVQFVPLTASIVYLLFGKL